MTVWISYTDMWSHKETIHRTTARKSNNVNTMRRSQRWCDDIPSSRTSHLGMVLLQVDQLLLETLHLHLQVRPGRGQIIQNLAQPGDVALH